MNSSDFVFAPTGAISLPNDALVVRVPGQIDKAHLLHLLARELSFPAYFRPNWDALEECLRDLSWLPPRQPLALCHQGLPLARRADQRAIFLDILSDAIQAQRAAGREILVVFPHDCRQAIAKCQVRDDEQAS